MKKKIFSIWSVLLILAVSIAIVVPGCDGACTGDIEVKATLCDAPWEGDVEYTLTLPGATAPTIIDGTSVNATHSGVECGNWTCEYVSGGPPDAYFADITLDPTQEVSDGGTITFTLNFELDQDAWINLAGDTWTVDGILIEEYGAQYMGSAWYAEVFPCQTIDVHFQQGVDGCEGRIAAINETSRLWITQTDGPGESPGPVELYVYNDLCAVNKTAEPPANPPEKVSQNTTSWGEFVYPGGVPIYLPMQEAVELDVETIWMLEKCLNYTKSINWFGISVFEPMPHPCVLFELVLPAPGVYTFILVAEAEVVLMDDTDVDTENNSTGLSDSLYIIVDTAGP